MTNEEFIAKGKKIAIENGIASELLEYAKTRAEVVVTFRSPQSTATAKFHFDTETGECTGGEYSGGEFTPKPQTGKSFSKRAQKVMSLASEESWRMRCDHVGSDHLLLALLIFADGAGSASLSELGLTADVVRSHISSVGSPPEDAPTGYGPSMRNILRLASKHCRTIGQPEIEPEHFVPALYDEECGPASEILKRFNVETGSAKKILLERISA